MMLRNIAAAAEAGLCAGGRSSSGRAGAVVGSSPKHRGTRPLNPIEILSNWDILTETCAVRFGVSGPGARDRLTHDVIIQMEHTLRNGFPDGVDAQLRSYQAVHDAVSGSRQSVHVLSHYPAPLCAAVLRQCGYDTDLLTIEVGGAKAVLEGVVNGGGDGSAAVAQHLQKVHAVMDNVAGLLPLKKLGGAGAASDRELLERLMEDSAATRGPALQLHLCEWGGTTPGMRAEAAGQGVVSVLSEVGLAQLLGVTHLDVVMDGIQWR